MEHALPANGYRSYRIRSIDLLRGLVMIIMALDHTRDFFHAAPPNTNPMDFHTTTPWLYFTRIITHLCAPIFVFLTGLSAYLQSERKTKGALSRFLITRGLWLVFVEIAIITLGITFDLSWGFIILQTIWSIGISMIILGLVVWLPFPLIMALGFAIVLGHNTLDYYEKAEKHVSVFYHFLHQPTVVSLAPGHLLGIFYPFLPWAGLMMMGFCAGKWFARGYDRNRRIRNLYITGIGLILAFIVLRYFNIYGNPRPWAHQDTFTHSLMDFLNVQKYPPSLLYMCYTIGPGMLFLALTETADNTLSRIITVYGKVPFFYYVLHFYILHLVNVIVYLLKGHSLAEGYGSDAFKFQLGSEGFGLPGVYLVWISVVVFLYPLCKWFAGVKQRHRHWWLSYL